jgi:hypothetical protein
MIWDLGRVWGFERIGQPMCLVERDVLGTTRKRLRHAASASSLGSAGSAGPAHPPALPDPVPNVLPPLPPPAMPAPPPLVVPAQPAAVRRGRGRPARTTQAKLLTSKALQKRVRYWRKRCFAAESKLKDAETSRKALLTNVRHFRVHIGVNLIVTKCPNLFSHLGVWGADVLCRCLRAGTASPYPKPPSPGDEKQIWGSPLDRVPPHPTPKLCEHVATFG